MPHPADTTLREAAFSPPASDPNVLQLLTEELTVGRTRVETGRVRVRVRTHRRTKAVDVSTVRHDVVVERVPIGLEVEAMPAPRQDGDTIIVPVVEEVLVLERKLILKEEVRIRRVRTSDDRQALVELRHQEATVERVPKAPSGDDSRERD